MDWLAGSPTVVRRGNPVDVLGGKLAGAAVDQVAQVASVDEQDLAFTRMTVRSGSIEEPQRRRNLSLKEQFGGPFLASPASGGRP